MTFFPIRRIHLNHRGGSPSAGRGPFLAEVPVRFLDHYEPLEPLFFLYGMELVVIPEEEEDLRDEPLVFVGGPIV